MESHSICLTEETVLDEFIDEGVPAAKPRLEDTEEAILQKVLEESLTDAYPTQRGPLPPVIIIRTILSHECHEESAPLCWDWDYPGSVTGYDEEMPSGVSGPNPDDVAESQPLPTPSVLAGPNLEHSDVEITDASSQPQPEHMDEGFIATAYPEVQENLKLTVDEQMIPEEPVSSTGTFGRKSAGGTELDKQGSRINKLETMDLPKMIREQTVEFIDSQEIDRKINESVKEVVISSVKHAMRDPLRAALRISLPYEALQDSIRCDECEDFDVDKAQEETKKKSKQDSPKTPPGSPPSPPPPPPPPSGASGASGTTGASDSAQAPPPPPPSSSTHQGGQSTSTAAPSSSKTAASAEYSAWTTTDTRIKPSITTIPDDLYMDDETTADEQAYSSGEEVGQDHIPTVNLRQSWWKPLTEDRPASPEPAWTIPSSDLPVPTNNWASALKTTYVPPPENSLLAQTGDIATFMDWYCKRQGISELTPKDLEGPAYEIVKAFFPMYVHLQYRWKNATRSVSRYQEDQVMVEMEIPYSSEVNS
ncbi:hypothetical protein Tco_0318822 [Tanacetum coccineum]